MSVKSTKLKLKLLWFTVAAGVPLCLWIIDEKDMGDRGGELFFKQNDSRQPKKEPEWVFATCLKGERQPDIFSTCFDNDTTSEAIFYWIKCVVHIYMCVYVFIY